MRNSSWFSGVVIAIALATTSLPVLCQDTQLPEPTYSVRISVDSGNLPFSAVLHGGDVPYVAKRDATRASSVKFADVPEGIHRLTVDMPGGKRAEKIVEVDAYYAAPRGEVRASVRQSDFRVVPHALMHELEVSATGLKTEDEVRRLLEESWPLAEAGDFTAAHALLRRAVTLDPDFHEGWNNLGVVAERQGFVHEAIHCYRQAIRLDEDCFLSNMNLSVSLTRLQQYDEATVYGQRAVESHPDSLVAQMQMAGLLLRTKDFRNAIPYLRAVIRLNGEQSDTPRLQLAAAYAESGQFGPAAQALRDWMRVHKEHPKFELVEAAMEDLAAMIDR